MNEITGHISDREFGETRWYGGTHFEVGPASITVQVKDEDLRHLDPNRPIIITQEG